MMEEIAIATMVKIANALGMSGEGFGAFSGAAGLVFLFLMLAMVRRILFRRRPNSMQIDAQTTKALEREAADQQTRYSILDINPSNPANWFDHK